MTSRWSSIAAAGAVGLTLWLYGLGLASSPSPLADEHAVFAAAQGLARTGRDAFGHRIPLFIQVGPDRWLQPVAVYASVPVVWMAGHAEWAPRVVSVIVAALNVGLLCLLGARLWPRHWAGTAAAGILMLTPAHYVFGRLGVDAVYAVPFVLTWLLLLVSYFSHRQRWMVGAAAASLGIGLLSQQAAPITMGLLLALTMLALWREGARDWGVYAWALAGFALPVTIVAAWFVRHPAAYLDTMGRWAIFAAHLRRPLDLWRATTNWTTLGARLSLYWDFFNPASLFFARDAEGVAALVRHPAPLPAAMMILVPLGMSRVLASARPGVAVLLVGGLMLAPVSSSTFGERYAIDYALTFLPFASLLAAAGAMALTQPQGSRPRRVLGVLLMLAVLLQGGALVLASLGR